NARSSAGKEAGPSRFSPRRSTSLRAPVVALATVSLLVLGNGAANAASAPQDNDPVGTLLGTVGQVLDQATKPLSQAPAPSAPQPKSPAAPVKKLVETVTKPLTSASHPSSPAPAATGGDTAQSKVGQVDLGKQDVAGVSGNESNAGAGSSSAYAELLSLGGYTIIGSQASSDGATTASGPVPANPLCMSTGGALCASLLYADSAATADGSHADTKTGLADICLGGDDPSGDTCGGVDLGAAQGTSSVTKQADGSNASASWTSLVNLCVTGADTCDVSANAVESKSGAGAEDGKPTLGALNLFGTDAALPDDPTHLQVPKNCDADDVLCAVLNDMQSANGGESKSAADADGLAGNLGTTLGSSSTTSSAGSTTPPPATGGPTGPDFATGTLEHLQLADNQVLDLSKNESQGTTDKTTADAVLLGVLGTTIIGSEASSDGTTSASGPVPANPLCDTTGGKLCLDLLYADSAASTTPQAADASTKTGVADLCLGGDDPTGASCSGIAAGIGQGESQLHKDKTTGQSQASSSTSLANLCLAGETGCTVSADAVGSDGSADTATGTTGSSTLADLGLDGTQVGAPSDPIEISVPTDCVDPSVACILLNQGDAMVSGNALSTTQSVLDVAGLGGTLGLTLAETTTQASTSTVEPPVVNPPVVEPPVVNPPNVATPKAPKANAADTGKDASALDAVLPNTGGVWSGLLGIALLLLVGGAALLVGRRRRTA
ncbi:MAG: hypothetical protein JWO46_1044, partial [Nocardioidaceae bacterium]|nr:hypothetical protein [Nocardioidaceae bacterium]